MAKMADFCRFYARKQNFQKSDFYVFTDNYRRFAATHPQEVRFHPQEVRFRYVKLLTYKDLPVLNIRTLEQEKGKWFSLPIPKVSLPISPF